MATIDQQFVEFVVKALVGDPDAVQINRTIDEKGVLLELSVAQEDLGRVIGKRGNTAQSIRTLLRALGTKNDARYNLKIVDPEGDQRRASAPPRSDDNNTSDDSTNDDFVATPVVNDSEEPVENQGSSNQWSHLSSSQDSSDDDNDDNSTAEVDNSTDDDEDSSTDAENDTVEKHKKDLADLDDLNL